MKKSITLKAPKGISKRKLSSDYIKAFGPDSNPGKLVLKADYPLRNLTHNQLIIAVPS